MPDLSQEETQELIGPYRIEEKLGSGGMGTVYKAYHIRLARPVALKRIRSELERRPTRRQRFLLEARAVARLSHPNIVQIYDILEDADGDWIVMELIEGVTLTRLLQAGPLEVPRVLSVALDIARGLAAAHSKGIVHRDLKADNIIITPSGQAKILDFGIAKLLDLEDDEKTTDNKLIGTPGSMSPEQAQQGTVDHRSDLFSLGTLLYELVTGTAPFKFEGNIFKTLMQVCFNDHQPIETHIPNIQEELVNLIDSLLEKKPQDRPQSADEVIMTLQRICGTQNTPIKILFVDDEPDLEGLIRQIYRKQLKSRKILLEFARDGKEALQKIKEDEVIAIVISDINMPNMDGLTLLDEINGLGRVILTVILSAFGDMKNIRTAMNLGAFDFLTKPIDFNDLELTRRKAVSEVTKLQSFLKLRQENDLLHERNRFIRTALSRYFLKKPFSNKPLDGSHRGHNELQVTTLKANIVDYEVLQVSFPRNEIFEILNKLFEEFSTVASHHGGVILQFHRGTFLIGFGLLTLQKEILQLAGDCALTLESTISSIKESNAISGGPELRLNIEINFEIISLDSPESNTLQYPLFDPTQLKSTANNRMSQQLTLIPGNSLSSWDESS